MALKGNWVDLEDAIEGVPNSGDDASAETINKIAHAVMELEDKGDGGNVDLSNYYTKPETDQKLTSYPPRSEVQVAINSLENNINKELSKKANAVTTYTKTEVDEIASKKIEETILYEDVVNTPEWTKQPTVVSGDVVSVFSKNDLYYVTLKDASGNALPSGQFMLKDFYTDGATVYSTVFSLANLDTGAKDKLNENYPVEFTSVGVIPKMRDAGVGYVVIEPSDWKLSGNRGKLRLVCVGQYIQRASNAYFVTGCIASENVANYHSISSTAYQSDSTRFIYPYSTVSNNASYKVNKYYDDFVIERLSDTRFITQRKVTLRYISYGSTSYSVKSDNILGYGEILNPNTKISSLRTSDASSPNRGWIRNGSVIRITEVK